MTFDEALPVIFMALMGISMLVYVISDGYDLGVGMLMPRATPAEKDVMIASIGPFWDANETWLVLGVGILLVAFPKAHGLVLTELYLPVMLMLIGLILRGVAFDFRVKAKAARKPRVLFMMSHSGAPLVSGRGTAANALLGFAGTVNVITEFDGYKPLTAEAMAAAAPDVIINTTQGIEALGGEAAFWQRPELALTPAFAKKALVTLEASHLLGFGPRLPTAVQELHQRTQQWMA